MKNNILSDKYLASFLEQLYMLVKAGIPLDESMSMLYKEEKNEESKKIFKSLLNELLEGKELYMALENTKVFPYYMVKMVKAGETTGKLESTLKSLYEYYNRVDRMNVTIKNAVIYPIALAIMMLTVIVILITKVMPIFSDVYEQLGSELIGFSLVVLKIGEFLNKYSLAFIILLIVFVLLVVLLIKTNKGKKILRKYFSKTELYKKIIGSRFTSVMAMALGSGLGIDEALNLSIETCNDPTLNESGKKIKEKLLNGESFSDAVDGTGLFNSVDTRFLSIGIKTGSIVSVMKQIADRSEENVEEHISLIIGRVEPTLVIILAVVTGIILLSVMIPLSNIISLIG